MSPPCSRSRAQLTLPSHALAFTHLIAFATWFGASIWTTFFAGIIMFKHLPDRQTFGRIQAHLFPAYFTLSSVLLATLLGLSIAAQKGGLPSTALIVAFGATLLNQLVVEPYTTRHARVDVSHVRFCGFRRFPAVL